jgi:succinate dehydrogenase/fumarate reductase-like Fe-S protein
MNLNPRSTSLRVRRGGPHGDPHYETFEVPFEPGMSVLDALCWIRSHADQTLAVRYSCINANACRTCVALVDGEVAYTCTARLTPPLNVVEPIASRPVLRDLVTDMVPPEEHLP